MSCEHPATTIVRVRYVRAGNEQVRELCDVCGSSLRSIKKAEFGADLESLPLVEDTFVAEWRERYYQNTEDERLRQREEERDRWWEKYTDYLETHKWREIRAKVLDRDKYVCQGCLSASAEQVHHLTYENVFNELAFQLVSLCHHCHRKIHDTRRAGSA